MTCTPTPAEAQIQVPEGAAARSTHATGTDSPSTPMAQTPRKGAPASYLVNLRSSSRADRLAGHKAVRLSGGQVVAAWAEIGVLVVQSTDTRFLGKVRGQRVVKSAGATRSVPVRTQPRNVAPRPAAGIRVPRERTQWNMTMIGADKARATPAAPNKVLVAVVDSGIDVAHPELAKAIDSRASVGCTDGGRPQTSRTAWRATTNEHGTHVAGIIAAARNGTGVTGVAPGVRLASIKVVDEHNMIYPEYALCGVMSAARVGAKVANHSYFVDPFVFWCDDQIGQAAIKESLRRAYRFSTGKGVVNVAAAGNSGLDLEGKSIDSESPTDGRAKIRRVNAGCHDLPTELPDVVTVSAVDRTRMLAPFSNSGLGTVDIAAPGDEVLSTVTGGRYAVESGTSMAAPHVSGVLALMAARRPGATPAQLTSLLYKQARPLPCDADAGCRSKGRVTSDFGHGLVDAAAAVR